MFLMFSILTIAGDGLLGWTDSLLEPEHPFLRFLLSYALLRWHMLSSGFELYGDYFQSSERK